MVLQWSEEDQTFLVLFPEWEGVEWHMPVSDGETYDKAFKRAKNALEAMVATMKAEGKPLPQPNYFQASDE
jgi:predicted RNase H-like HicB family nuclease